LVGKKKPSDWDTTRENTKRWGLGAKEKAQSVGAPHDTNPYYQLLEF
jgi:hypothetical protein